MARVRLTSGLTQKIAALVASRVDEVADEVASNARAGAPDGKVWQTDADEQVRPSHAEAHGQLIPDNVPFRLPRMQYVNKGRGRNANPAGGWTKLPGWDLGDRPRDEQLPFHQVVNCRCRKIDLPGAVAATVTTSPARPSGRTVAASVSVAFPRVAESEYADQDGGWFNAAARQAAAAHRARRR
ncbi:hypothetical protein [Nonomuraea recticatena]|uniref:Phage head morphogenesis domain-containing protein n=1 Tax=Nonomuraea recticatena TaxID=46178 RepID=A0ABP6FHH1_9ACTN